MRISESSIKKMKKKRIFNLLKAIVSIVLGCKTNCGLTLLCQ